MSYCPKCGNKVDETMTFCPKCGASLRMDATPRSTPQPTYRRQEKSEKSEKNEKNEPEKGEKHEKGEFGSMGWLIGGIIIIIVGIFAYARAVDLIAPQYESPIVLLAIGIVVIIVAAYLSTRARRRSPPPPA
jgi:rRNA maturation protein Nop10